MHRLGNIKFYRFTLIYVGFTLLSNLVKVIHFITRKTDRTMSGALNWTISVHFGALLSGLGEHDYVIPISAVIDLKLQEKQSLRGAVWTSGR